MRWQIILLYGSLEGVVLAGCTVTGGDQPIHAHMHPVRMSERTATAGDTRFGAQEYMATKHALMGLSKNDHFEVLSHRQGQGSIEHVRMQQTHHGVPVWGADVVVHRARDTVWAASGNVVSGLDGLDTTPLVDAEAAVAMAKHDYARHAPVAAELAYARESAKLIVFLHAGTPHLAWHVELSTELQVGIEPGRWQYFIDAHTRRLIKKANWLHTLDQASGPGGNLDVSRVWNDELDVEPLGNDQYAMDTDRLQTLDMGNTTSQEQIVVGPLDPIGDAPVNDAHGFAEITLDMLRDWMGYDSIDGNGFVIRSRVHYENNYENAFWDGIQVTYGDGASTFFPMSGDIDIVAHEIHHGFTEFHSNLIYDGMPGGLNESFSDIAGTTVEFYHEGTAADFDIGKDIVRNGSALRFMCDPTADGVSIDHASDYRLDMDVHLSSGVSNKAFCLTARRLSSGSADGDATPAGVRRAAQAWYEANANYWTAGTTFTQGCQGTIDAATALGYTQTEREAIRDSWSDVGVYCDGLVPPLICDAVHTQHSGVLTSPSFPQQYPNNWDFTDCIVPDGEGVVTMTFTDFSTVPAYDFVEVSDGSTGLQLSYISGSEGPPPLSGPILVVRFTSSSSNAGRGWRAVWTTMSNGNASPNASFTHDSSGGTTVFMDTSFDTDGTIAKWLWDFGDGMRSSLQNPAHTYAADGVYMVTLTVHDDDGAEATTSMQIIVAALPPDAAAPDAGMPLQDASVEEDANHMASDAGMDLPDVDAMSSREQDSQQRGGCVVSGYSSTPPWVPASLILIVFLLDRRIGGARKR